MKKIIVILLLLVGIIAIPLFLIYLNLNIIVKQGIEKIGPKITKTSVTLNKAKISLFSGQGTLYDFTVGNPKGFVSPYLFKVKNVHIGLRPMSLFKDTIVIDKIYIDSPYIVYEYANNNSNLGVFEKNIQPKKQAKSTTETDANKKTKSKKHILIKEFIIKNAQVEVFFPKLGIRKKQVLVKEIRLTNLGGKNKSPKQIIAQITKALLDRVGLDISPILGQLKSGLRDVKSKLKNNLQELKQGNLNKDNLKSKVKDLKSQFNGILPKK